MDSGHAALIERTRGALRDAGLRQALLSSPETVAQLTGLIVPYEDWPIADPFTAAPPMLLLTETDAILIVPTLYLLYAADMDFNVVEARTHRFRGVPPDPWAELEHTLADLPRIDAPIGVEGRSLPARVGELLRAHGTEPRWIDDVLVRARRRKLGSEIEAIRAASRVADLIQATIKEAAEPGQTEAELAGIAMARVACDQRQRVAAQLSIDAGEASATGSTIPSGRRLRLGDLVLTDAVPWVAGMWSDTANTIVVGPPTREQRRVFDAVRRSLDLAISLCRPGAIAGDIDAQVRASLAEFGDAVYRHHTGHGLGVSWNELPRIIPGSGDVIEEEMVIAVEPAVYIPGWGGLRLEHVLVVREGGNELLSLFEHTL